MFSQCPASALLCASVCHPRVSAPPMLASGGLASGGLVVALDLDGVLCDSEPELALTAWRTACQLWPDVMAKAAYLEQTLDSPAQLGARRSWTDGDWEALSGNGEDGLPNWLKAKLRLLRPIVERGFETVLLARLCADEALASGARKRPLTIGEITANWGPDMREMLLARYQLSEAEAIEAFGACRAAWLADSSESWFAANAFYDGAVNALRSAVARAEPAAEIYLVTSKEQRFAGELLQRAGVPLESERIFGLGSGPKGDTLCTLQQQHAGATLRFVEGKAETVRSVASDLRLLGVELYFAGWGHSTPEQKALVASMPRVRPLVECEQLASVLQPVP